MYTDSGFFMPATPFHLAFGAGIKALCFSSFSFSIFCYVQILIDLESLYNLLFGKYPIHGFLHTYLGSSLVAIFCGLSGVKFRALLKKVLSFIKLEHLLEVEVNLKVSMVSAFLGSLSHIVLDSIMHKDMSPLYPLSDSNILLSLLSLANLHLLCMLPGIGAYIWFEARRKRARDEL